MDRLPIALQNTYLDLLGRLEDARVAGRAPPDTFVSKLVKGRRYWYIQPATTSAAPRRQTYIGPETPALLARMEANQRLRVDADERAMLVRTLQASRSFPPLPGAIGRALSAMADAGVFRLRAVLVGTVAFHAYAAMLGIKLGQASFTTEDVDVAQFRSISIAVEDETPDMLNILRQVDPDYEALPSLYPMAPPTRYRTRGVKVEFLTPMRGPQEMQPVALPSLGTGAEPLRYLDYLIYEEQPAALLFGAGILVNVPSPARFVWHKLILSQVRTTDRQKARKDILQAQTLLPVLAEDRPYELRSAWKDLATDGRVTWQETAKAGIAAMDPQVANLARDLIQSA
ncbi:hypothetical protein EBE87_24190 [Pseudoroseomonas wenyumeiae]|uniref:Nucleotidyltransferase-like domain-containing protein n=1 Tax=Teichococcus wenyumeiae TaxID=2478470 RepID=A0ABX9VCY8_9PROT|nr:GSU2403 family nucleotidyltransferase fold protein [Pseudoroseomonas wenyumeiae]RMI17084.1 hypothetical protein EBE87_24190 [Pseudoroseomonas wenyumeiae]